jgi:hypothetical protein
MSRKKKRKVGAGSDVSSVNSPPDFGATIDPSMDPTSSAPSELDNFADVTGQEVIPVIPHYWSPPTGPTPPDEPQTYAPPSPEATFTLGQNYGAQLPMSPVSATSAHTGSDAATDAQNRLIAAASALISSPASPRVVSPYVVAFQSAYNAVGYSPSLTVDGRMGPATSAALQSVVGGLMTTGSGAIAQRSAASAAFSGDAYHGYLQGALTRIAGCNCSRAAADMGVADVVPPSTDTYLPDPGTSSSLGQVFSSLAGMFSAMSQAPGAPTAGQLGAVAQDAYDVATRTTSPAVVIASQPLPTAGAAAKAAHAAGVAAANGTAKVLNGAAPAPQGDLSQAAESARVIFHGLEGAPAEVRSSVLSAIAAAPGAQAGLARAALESGGSTMNWYAMAGLAILGLGVWWASTRTPQGRRLAY